MLQQEPKDELASLPSLLCSPVRRSCLSVDFLFPWSTVPVVHHSPLRLRIALSGHNRTPWPSSSILIYPTTPAHRSCPTVTSTDLISPSKAAVTPPDTGVRFRGKSLNLLNGVFRLLFWLRRRGGGRGCMGLRGMEGPCSIMVGRSMGRLVSSCVDLSQVRTDIGAVT